MYNIPRDSETVHMTKEHYMSWETPSSPFVFLEIEVKKETFCSTQHLNYTEGMSCIKTQSLKCKDPHTVFAAFTILQILIRKMSHWSFSWGYKGHQGHCKAAFCVAWMIVKLPTTPHQPRKPISLCPNPPSQFSYAFILFSGSTK